MIRIEYADGLTSALRDAVHALRAEVFSTRLQWDVVVRNGLEQDVYDTLNPLLVLSLDERTGAVRGCVRLLPTTGPHMMADLFSGMFQTPIDVRGPTVWECTRFCIAPGCEQQTGRHGIAVATSELLYGVCALGLRSGVEQMLGVSESAMLRIYRRSGWDPEVIAFGQPAGGAPVFAGLWDVNTESLDAIAARAGFQMEVVWPPGPQAAGHHIAA